MTELTVELLWVSSPRNAPFGDTWSRCSECDDRSDFYLFRRPEHEDQFSTLLANKNIEYSDHFSPGLVLCFDCFAMTFVDDPRVIADTYYNTTSPYYTLTVRPQPRNKKAPF